jgi:hypothetical protein
MPGKDIFHPKKGVGGKAVEKASEYRHNLPATR